MANRLMVRNHMSKEKAPVVLFGKFSVGAVGEPTINAVQSQGIVSITRTGVGAYTLSLGQSSISSDTYNRLMMAKHVSISALSTAIQMSVVADNSASPSLHNIQIQFLNGSGAAVEVGSGEIILLELIFSNTSV